jgi:hypothetical protein
MNIEEVAEKRAGLMSEFALECNSCNEASNFSTSINAASQGRSHDINRRAVYHSVDTGSGYEGLASFCSIFNMPCISKPAYYKQVENIMGSLEEEAKEEMRQAGQRLRQLILAENPEQAAEDILDVAVTFDGTWAKRGFTSLTGVVFVISVDTGEVLDYHVLSKACQKCSIKRSKTTDEEFEEWFLQHECDINFVGSSPAMESEGAVTLWERSIETHNLRYRWMVSDGDSKAFNSVEDIYGEVKVEKLDCVGHVQKRIGKHLTNLKSTTKGKLSDGHTIGGRGWLTEAKIQQLQKYYGLAIRQNTIKKLNPTKQETDVAVYTMKKNIIAILHHCCKGKTLAQQHRFCPKGESSWCKWQQDVATGTKTYLSNEECLPEVFRDVLKPTFLVLSETSLLERCVLGATQNQNESLNGLVWARCPKRKHHGHKAVRCAVASAVCHFHKGCESRMRAMRRLSIPAGENTKKACNVIDKQRMKKSDLQATEKEKKRRQGDKLLHTRREEALRAAEGVTYEAGAF